MSTKPRIMKFGIKKLEAALYHVVQSVFRYSESFRCGPQV